MAKIVAVNKVRLELHLKKLEKLKKDVKAYEDGKKLIRSLQLLKL
jgi:hypothetical protein